MYDPNAMWQANRMRQPPTYTPQVQRPQPVYRPQNGLGMLGQLPNEQPPPQMPGYLPQEPGAYQQPGYNTGIVPPGFNQRPPMYGVNDGNQMPGYQGQPFTQPNKGGTMGFGDASHFPPMLHPWQRRLWDRGGR